MYASKRSRRLPNLHLSASTTQVHCTCAHPPHTCIPQRLRAEVNSVERLAFSKRSTHNTQCGGGCQHGLWLRAQTPAPSNVCVACKRVGKKHAPLRGCTLTHLRATCTGARETAEHALFAKRAKAHMLIFWCCRIEWRSRADGVEVHCTCLLARHRTSTWVRTEG